MVLQKNRLCPHCGSDLHCCKNCSHFDESLSSKCREPESPWIPERVGQNTCPYFEFATDPHSKECHKEVLSEAERAKEAFRALFRNL
ncbi:MAG: hypothetical protein H6617_09145 [Bdellovibrionaceae bacterium]|nr:hypothetical protein [Bdellovibrionales bacterium]MCB9254833.1 hypothetical protein [Pseudobdellovibrionaceae bacterium]